MLKYICLFSVALNFFLYALVGQFIPMRLEMLKVEKIDYGEKPCLPASKELQKRLSDKGIQSSIVIGESPRTLKQPNVRHAWVAIWIEPQEGWFTKEYELDNF